MRKLLVILMATIAVAGVARAEHRFGVGANYWKTVDNIDVHDFDDSGLSYLASYQYRPASLIGFEADVEWFNTNLGVDEVDIYMPQAFLLLGKAIYGGIGIGLPYADGNWADDPVYILRAGLDLELLPSIHIDINANYRFMNWDSLNDSNSNIDTDTVTIGAAVRIAL